MQFFSHHAHGPELPGDGEDTNSGPREMDVPHSADCVVRFQHPRSANIELVSDVGSPRRKL